MQSKEKENLIFVRLSPNKDVFEELEKVCKRHKVKIAILISGIG